MKGAFADLLAAIACALFGAVYERFSYGVYSNYMLYAFLVPLAGGALPLLALALRPCRRPPGRAARGLYHAGLAAMTVGCLFQGALEIYGTTNGLVRVYWCAGACLIAAGILAAFWGARRAQGGRRPPSA